MASRMWRVHKEAKRPWPVLDSDPLIDFQIMEAVALKVADEDEQARKEREIADWKKDRDKLKEFA